MLRRALDHPRYVAVALGTFALQQQVAALYGPGEIGDPHFVSALLAPDVGQQALADIGRGWTPGAGGRDG